LKIKINIGILGFTDEGNLKPNNFKGICSFVCKYFGRSFDIDIEIVWQTVAGNLPALLQKLKKNF